MCQALAEPRAGWKRSVVSERWLLCAEHLSRCSRLRPSSCCGRRRRGRRVTTHPLRRRRPRLRQRGFSPACCRGPARRTHRHWWRSGSPQSSSGSCSSWLCVAVGLSHAGSPEKRTALLTWVGRYRKPPTRSPLPESTQRRQQLPSVRVRDPHDLGRLVEARQHVEVVGLDAAIAAHCQRRELGVALRR
jgi:hypothetical protein